MINKQKGFTLIELLVVIAIIGLLSTLAVVALNNARSKSRDARRLSDVKSIQTALELYNNEVGSYPAAVTPGGQIANNGNVFMGKVPSDPASSTLPYTYTPLATTFATYTLEYVLENDTAGIDAGAHSASESSISE